MGDTVARSGDALPRNDHRSDTALSDTLTFTTRELVLSFFAAITALLTPDQTERRGGQRYFERGNPLSSHSSHSAAAKARH